MTAPLLIVLGGLSALAYWPLSRRDPSLMRSLLKTASVGVLALAALDSGAILLAFALGLCALGDWCLSRAGDRAFLAGVGAFAAGHVAYVALFHGDPASQPALLWAAPQVWVALALCAAGIVLAPALFARAGPLRWAVLAYVPVILAMGLSALALSGAGWGVALAAGAFVLSDMALAAELFLLKPGTAAYRIAPLAVWPLYWGAQAGFAILLGGGTAP